MLIHQQALKDKLHHHINKCRKKIYKNPTFFHDEKKRILSKPGIEENFLNLIKNIYKSLHLTSYLIMIKQKFLLWLGKSKGCPLSPILFDIILEVLNSIIIPVSLVAYLVKNLPAKQETWVQLGRPSGRGHGNPFQYSCLENSHGQRSMAGCSPWGHKRVRHN